MAALGDRCWVASEDASVVWERGRVERREEVGGSGGGVALAVRLDGSGELWETEVADAAALDRCCKPCNPEAPAAVRDLVALSHLHEAAILHVVRARAAAAAPYLPVSLTSR